MCSYRINIRDGTGEKHVLQKSILILSLTCFIFFPSQLMHTCILGSLILYEIVLHGRHFKQKQLTFIIYSINKESPLSPWVKLNIILKIFGISYTTKMSRS